MDTDILAIAIATGEYSCRMRQTPLPLVLRSEPCLSLKVLLPQPWGKSWEGSGGWAPDCALVWGWVVSFFVFVLAILLLLLYHRDPQCCQLLCSCRFLQGPSQCDSPPPYFSNNQDLMGPSARSQTSERMRTRVQGHFQGDEVFCVGLPSNYQLPHWYPPRLPSYESVRKKDRQQQIHRLIAHRFGLWACRELPPTYEESLGSLPEVPPSPGSAPPFQRTTAFPTQRNTAV
ncbi:uncharacterized protein LOC116423627 [Sarcophilus harrisii]|uniref:uncharacterized protein LOC116423627 n=1 Tax=Sarcophilus harrisii TaxID=9305 RepID=UPI001301CBEC|nr:uncharacterized protein LOC116423627 [Sarcophilus harrisii]